MTWLELPADTGFGLDNLPYGIFSTAGTEPRTGVAIGDRSRSGVRCMPPALGARDLSQRTLRLTALAGAPRVSASPASAPPCSSETDPGGQPSSSSNPSSRSAVRGAAGDGFHTTEFP